MKEVGQGHSECFFYKDTHNFQLHESYESTITLESICKECLDLLCNVWNNLTLSASYYMAYVKLHYLKDQTHICTLRSHKSALFC